MTSASQWITEATAARILFEAKPCPTCGNHPKLMQLATKYGTSASTVQRLVTGQHRFSGVEPVDPAQS